MLNTTIKYITVDDIIIVLQFDRGYIQRNVSLSTKTHYFCKVYNDRVNVLFKLPLL